ncbi:15830_t:CDS:1, partial [Gigaspora margarita]
SEITQMARKYQNICYHQTINTKQYWHKDDKSICGWQLEYSHKSFEFNFLINLKWDELNATSNNERVAIQYYHEIGALNN